MQRIRARKIRLWFQDQLTRCQSVTEQLIQNQLYCDGGGPEDSGPAVESKRHGTPLPENKSRLVNRCCPQGIVESNQTLGGSGSGMSGSDFDPSSPTFLRGSISATKHAVRQLGPCAALPESQFQVQ